MRLQRKLGQFIQDKISQDSYYQLIFLFVLLILAPSVGLHFKVKIIKLINSNF